MAEHNISKYNFNCVPSMKAALARMNSHVEFVFDVLQETTLTEKETDKIIRLFSENVDRTIDLTHAILDDHIRMKLSEAIRISGNLVRRKFSDYRSIHKRNVAISKNELYVVPQQIAIGMRWESIRIMVRERPRSIQRRIQTYMQYTPLVKTLESIFKQKKFRDLYLDYNKNGEHKCQEGKYSLFCCGSVSQSNELFQSEPWSLALELSADEYEVCNPLGAKAGLHKIWGIYFSIRNLPPEFTSKVRNRYLLAILVINAGDVQNDYTDFNNIWRPIVRDLAYLEVHGIQTDGLEKNLRGTISNIVMDNLGANVSLGFVASFNANYYCRVCEEDKHTCQRATVENLSKFRTRDSYDRQIGIVQDSEKVDYNVTKGVKYYCELSNLKYFHVIENPCADIMHDLLEGAIPFYLGLFFKFCFEKKIFSCNQLNLMINGYGYGRLNTSMKPSDVCLEKRSLGLSAMQSKCLMKHIPFVLLQYRNNNALEDYWRGIQNLLLIIEIVFSRDIEKNDLTVLRRETEAFLSTVISFQRNLIPKLHFMSHYATLIE